MAEKNRLISGLAELAHKLYNVAKLRHAEFL